jgi:hypothetical protein
VALAVREGADILRIHDRSSLQAMRLAGQVRSAIPVSSQKPADSAGNCERTAGSAG